MLADRPLADLTESDFAALVDTSQREGLRLEFKRDSYGGGDGSTRELLTDVSSFANAHGGLLLIGVVEKDACASEVVGLDGKMDGEVLRLTEKIRSGVAPRIQGLGIRAVPLGTGKHVIAVRIPRSWAGPHMVTFKNASRFYSRTSGGKYQLDVSELRSLFLGSAALTERIRSYRLGRVNEVELGRTPIARSRCLSSKRGPRERALRR